MSARTLVILVEHTDRGETHTFRIDLDKAAYIHVKCPDDLFRTGRYIAEALHMIGRGTYTGDLPFIASRSVTNNLDEFAKIAASDRDFFEHVLVIEATQPVEIDRVGDYHFVCVPIRLA